HLYRGRRRAERAGNAAIGQAHRSADHGCGVTGWAQWPAGRRCGAGLAAATEGAVHHRLRGECRVQPRTHRARHGGADQAVRDLGAGAARRANARAELSQRLRGSSTISDGVSTPLPSTSRVWNIFCEPAEYSETVSTPSRLLSRLRIFSAGDSGWFAHTMLSAP